MSSAALKGARSGRYFVPAGGNMPWRRDGRQP